MTKSINPKGALQDLPSLSIVEIAEACNVSELTVRRRIADGTLPAYRVGNQIRIKPSDLGRLIQRIPTSKGNA